MKSFSGKTQAEIDAQEIQAKISDLNNQLAAMDLIIPRCIEDLYADTGKKPYKTAQETIDKKNTIRKQLSALGGKKQVPLQCTK